MEKMEVGIEDATISGLKQPFHAQVIQQPDVALVGIEDATISGLKPGTGLWFLVYGLWFGSQKHGPLHVVLEGIDDGNEWQAERNQKRATINPEPVLCWNRRRDY